MKFEDDNLPIIRKMLSISILLFALFILLNDCADAEDNNYLLGPIAHIEVEQKKIGDTRYFQLNGINSYMHVGNLVEYEWHFALNDTTEYYLYGPFQTLVISQPVIYNITLKVTSDDTREDTKNMNITLKDDGYGSYLMSMHIVQDQRLVEKLEAERAPPKDEQDLTVHFIIIGALGFLAFAELITIFILVLKRRKDQ